MGPSLAAGATGFSAEMFTGLILGSLVAPVIIAIVLPFSASLLLDGLVLMLRGRGIKPLIFALALALAAATGATGVIALAMGSPGSAQQFATTAELLLPWGCGLAGLAFLIRQAKAALRR